LVDDVRGLGVRTRLGIEALLAGCVAGSGVRLGLPGPVWLDVLGTTVGIVALTNSFNLLDNADGALATVACVTSVPLAVCAFLGGRPAWGLVLSCLSTACAGFLAHNAPPARIFLGDCGSLFIGFLIATGAVWIHPAHGGGPGRAAFPLLVVFLAVADTVLVVVSRQLAGRSWWLGGTDHLAHRLRRLGLGANTVLVLLLFGAAGAGLLAVLVSGGLVPGWPALLGVALAVAAVVVVLLGVPGYPPDPAPSAAGLVYPHKPRPRTTYRG
jgi:UDP-GlcNAc:undecaprenyl-phosphate GlcNAc-1-phosphate transferase